MRIEAHFQTLSAEFSALKDRVRNIIEDAHWQTDGEWRESILRSVLRRHLPETVRVGRGFITTRSACSTQIDVLLYDSSAPVLYREEDLVIVTPDAVLGIIEVKSRLRHGDICEAVGKLVANARLAVDGEMQPRAIALGLFAYDVEAPGGGDPRWVLDELQRAAEENDGGTVTQVCIGSDHFVHFWPTEPGVWFSGAYEYWHLYRLPHMAPGYFLNNIVHEVAGEWVENNHGVWFPEQSKEVGLVHRVRRLPVVTP